MKKLFIILSVLIVAAGCGDNIREPFTKDAWAPQVGPRPYNHRVLVIGDLEKNHLFKGMSRSEIIDLLGEPELNTSILIGYSVFEEIDESDGKLHLTRLKIQFTKEGQKMTRIFYQEEYESDMQRKLN